METIPYPLPKARNPTIPYPLTSKARNPTNSLSTSDKTKNNDPISSITYTSSLPLSPADQRQHLPGAIPIPNRKFTDPSVILQIMLHERPSVKAIPQGGKENVLFVLGNENNSTRQAYRQRLCYAVGLGHMDLVKHTITLCLKISLDNVDKR